MFLMIIMHRCTGHPTYHTANAIVDMVIDLHGSAREGVDREGSRLRTALDGQTNSVKKKTEFVCTSSTRPLSAGRNGARRPDRSVKKNRFLLSVVNRSLSAGSLVEHNIMVTNITKLPMPAGCMTDDGRRNEPWPCNILHYHQ